MKRRKLLLTKLKLLQLFVIYFNCFSLLNISSFATENIEVCPENICQNNGKCFIDDLNERFYCECDKPFTGTICQFTETQKPCNLKCTNGGYCKRDNRFMREICICKSGFRGDLCAEIEDCTNIPCPKNKTCLYDVKTETFNCENNYCELNKPCEFNSTCRPSNNDYFCECSLGLTGKNCSIDVNECQNNEQICKNNGICNNTFGNFTCECSIGFTGRFCEKFVGFCNQNPCQNKAICREHETSYSCDCLKNFSGKNCELNLIKICNENQQLIDMGNGTKECQCLNGYTGFKCEKHIDFNINQIINSSVKNNHRILITKKIDDSNFLTTKLPIFQSNNLLSNLSNSSFSSMFLLNKTANKKILNFDNQDESILYNNYNCSTLNCIDSKICLLKWDKNNMQSFAYCDCPPGQSGDDCSKSTSVTFDNSSVFLYENFEFKKKTSLNLLNFNYLIEFSFQTTLSYVTLAIGENISGKNEFSIILENGQLIINIFNQIKVELLKQKALNDANWYKIILRNSDTFVNIELLNDNENFVLDKRELILNNTMQVFMTRFGRKEDEYFVGCLRDVKINEQLINFFHPNARSFGILNGCKRRKQCNNNLTTYFCANNGKCIDLWTDYQCLCERPFFGLKCQEKFQEVTFGHLNQSSLIKYKLKDEDTLNIRSKTKISMFVRTNVLNAIIFYLGENNDENDATFISAEIVLGFFLINARIGGQQIFSQKTKQLINDNNEHFIEISRVNNNIKIIIDGVEDKNAQINIIRSFEHPLLSKILLLGASENIQQNAFQNNKNVLFKGTIQDFRINNKFVLLENDFENFIKNKPNLLNDLTNSTVFGNRILSKNILKGTISDDICTKNNPCKNGICENTFNSFQCKCNLGWMNNLCDIRDYCVLPNNPCLNKLDCMNVNGGYVCVSPSTFTKTSFANFIIHLSPHYLSPMKQTNMSFEIRTRSTEANLLKLISSTESLIITLSKNNSILINFHNTTFSIIETIFLTKLNATLKDAKWHTVLLIDNINHLEFYLDNILILSKMTVSFSLKRFALDSSSQIIFGKADEHFSFKGCLKNVKFGSLPPLSFYEDEKGLGGFDDESHQIIYFKLLKTQNIRNNGCFSDEVCFDSKLNPCKNEGICKDLFNLRNCDCPIGFSGEFCEINIDDCNIINNNHQNVSKKCGLHGLCIDEINNYTCKCDAGFTGLNCKINELINDDKCKEYSNTCLNGGKCQMTSDGDLKCICELNYLGQYCQTLKTNDCTNNPCENNGKCIAMENGFYCNCSEKFSGDLCDILIENVDPCRQRLCQNGGICHSTPDQTVYSLLMPYKKFPTYLEQNFTCECRIGFEGRRCEQFTDLCTSSKKCDNDGVCENIFGGYICHCKKGWHGSDCSIDINECDESAPCENGALCENLNGSFKCHCPKYYFGNYCEIAGECAQLPCKNDAYCSQNSPNDYFCQCKRGYSGNFCEKEIDFCSDEPCKNGATCHNMIGSFECFCIAGYTGVYCETDIDECTLAGPFACSNNGTCIDKINAYECNCNNTGFTGSQCLNDIDECSVIADKILFDKHSEANISEIILTQNLSQTTLKTKKQIILLNCVHGFCTNLPGSYSCDCDEGFIGKRCNIVNPCTVNLHTNRSLHSCAHGHCVNPQIIQQENGKELAQHDCDCFDGYTGLQCSFLVETPKTLSIGFIIGPILILLIVLCVFGTMLFFFVAKKKRATQGTYSPSTQEMAGTIYAPRHSSQNVSLSAYKYTNNNSLKLKDNVKASLNVF